MNATEPIRLERTYDASAATIWELWTTAEGIESWWAPDGYVTEVRTLDVRPGGELVYAMTATAALRASDGGGPDAGRRRRQVVMTVEPLHDEVWTERLVAGRANELDNLAAVIAKRNAA